MNRLVKLPDEADSAADALFSYMRERYGIYLRRQAGDEGPWTEDTILQEYKFTNVYREYDYTTRMLSKIYETKLKRPLDEVLVNAATFRYFGHWPTCEDIGWMEEFDEYRVKKVVKNRKEAGQQVFTGAYVITNAGRSEPKEVVVCDNLIALESHAHHIMAQAEIHDSWQTLAELMSVIPGFGGSGFMAKETILDVMLYHWQPADYKTYTPVGPGAKRGLNRLAGRDIKQSAKPEIMLGEILSLLADIYLKWTGPKLTAHDIQFCLCEYDKYCRVALGQGRPRSKFKPRKDIDRYTIEEVT